MTTAEIIRIITNSTTVNLCKKQKPGDLSPGGKETI